MLVTGDTTEQVAGGTWPALPSKYVGIINEDDLKAVSLVDHRLQQIAHALLAQMVERALPILTVKARMVVNEQAVLHLWPNRHAVKFPQCFPQS